LHAATRHAERQLSRPQRRIGGLQHNVLTLNRNFHPVQVISVKRAMCLICKGLAEVLHNDGGQFAVYDFDGWRELSELQEMVDGSDSDDWIRSVHFSILAPKIIRLLKYDRVPRTMVKFNRKNIFLRDEFRCQYCGDRFATQNLSLDHVLPRCRGGNDSWENVVCACRKCNVTKGGRTPDEARMTLLRRPTKPARSPILTRQLTQRRYACWKPFLNVLGGEQS
jgi:5-methylcytosine-specific restriction endonuclease McrA